MNVKNNTTKEVIRNLWLKRKEVTSTSGLDGINMMFTHPSGTREKQTKYMKWQAVWHWTWGNKGQWCLRDSITLSEPFIESDDWVEVCSRPHNNEGCSGKPSRLCPVRRQHKKSVEDNVAKVDRTEYQRKESCREKEPWRSVEGPLAFWSVHVCEETTWAQKKNHLKGLDTILSNWTHRDWK